MWTTSVYHPLKNKQATKACAKFLVVVLNTGGRGRERCLCYCLLSATSLFVIVVHTRYLNFIGGATDQYCHGKPSCCLFNRHELFLCLLIQSHSMVYAIQPSNGANNVCVKTMTTTEDGGHSERAISAYYEIRNYIPNHASIQDSVTEMRDLDFLRFYIIIICLHLLKC